MDFPHNPAHPGDVIREGCLGDESPAARPCASASILASSSSSSQAATASRPL